MPNPVQTLIKFHDETEGHGWFGLDTSHIKNVSLLESHWLMECKCGWKGWIHKKAWDTFYSAKWGVENA